MNALLTACPDASLLDAWPLFAVGVFVGATGVLLVLDLLTKGPR